MADRLTDLLADALRSNYDRYRNSRAGVVVAALRANPDVVLSALEEWGVEEERLGGYRYCTCGHKEWQHRDGPCNLPGCICGRWEEDPAYSKPAKHRFVTPWQPVARQQEGANGG